MRQGLNVSKNMKNKKMEPFAFPVCVELLGSMIQNVAVVVVGQQPHFKGCLIFESAPGKISHSRASGRNTAALPVFAGWMGGRMKLSPRTWPESDCSRFWSLFSLLFLATAEHSKD